MAVTADILNLPVKGNFGDVLAFPVKTGEKIYRGSFIANETASGMAVNVAAAKLADYNKIMVAIEGFDNTNGANGSLAEGASARTVKALAGGQIFLGTFSSVAAADTGKDVYCADNATLTTTSGGPKVGKILQVISSTQAWIYLNY